MGTAGWLVTCLVCFGAVGLGIAASNDESQFRKPVNCRSRDNGNFVWGCSQFYSMCDNGQEVPMQCFSDLVLNPKNNFCDRRANVPACKDPSATRDTLYKAKDPFTCDRKRDGQYAKDDCSAEYILCNHGNQQILRCPPGTFYDPKEDVCGWPAEIAGCNPDSSSSASAEDDIIVERGSSRSSSQGRPQPSVELPQPPSGQPEPSEGQPQPSEELPEPIEGQPQPSEGELQQQQGQLLPSEGQTQLPNGQLQTSQGEAQLPSGQPQPSQGQLPQPGAPISGHMGRPQQRPERRRQNHHHHHHRQHRRARRGAQLQYSPYNQQQPQTPSIGAPIAQPIQDPAAHAYQQLQPIPQDPPARPVAFDCSQHSDGHYAGQPCAKDYVACVAGQAHEFQCPAGLVFDAEIKGCDYPSECGKPRPTTARAPISFDCRARPDGYHTNGPCTKDYYHCLAGTTFALACPGGTVFDSAIKACDWPETCGQPRAPPPAADAAPINPYQQVAPPAPPADAIRPASLDCSQRADGIHVEQPCQNHYWSCANGLAHQFACAPGTLFDPNTQSCEFADACGKAAPAPPAADPIIPAFLESHGGYLFQPQQQQQSYGQQPQQQQSPPAITISIVAPVPPVEQKPAPLTTALDCSRQPDGFYEQGHCQQNYVQCANGIAHVQQCQAGLVFRIDRCEFPADCANPPQPLAVAPEAPAQSEPSAEIVTTQTSEASCSSLTDGNHPVADCSQEYSSCWGGAGVRAKCPGSLFYNPENDFCDHRENVAGCNNLAAQEDAPAFSCGAKLPGFYGSGCSG
ncbi:Protein C39D10.7, partial [Aphelenchoides avenae]